MIIDDDIAKARAKIANFSLTGADPGGFIYAARRGWPAALDEVERLRKPIDDTPPDAPTTASTIEYARNYLASESDGELTLDQFQASCFAMVLIRVSAARSQLAGEVDRLRALVATACDTLGVVGQGADAEAIRIASGARCGSPETPSSCFSVPPTHKGAVLK